MQLLKKTSEYNDLHVIPSEWGVVYGPITSRRLGSSLGINLSGSEEKICNFDCPYCEVGRTTTKLSQIKTHSGFPSLDSLKTHLENEIVSLGKKGIPFDMITLAGNGEPTLHPQFEEAIAIILEVRSQLTPKTPIGILSNGATLDGSKIITALNKIDQRMIKLDAGSDTSLKKINEPLTRFSIEKLINGCSNLTDCHLQSFFVQGSIDNTSANEVEEWIEVVGIIKPKQVHLHTLDRVPPILGLVPASKQRLKEIANRLEKKTMIQGLVFA